LPFALRGRHLNVGQVLIAQFRPGTTAMFANSVLLTFAQSQGYKASFHPHKPTRKKGPRRIAYKRYAGVQIVRAAYAVR
jgi:hypothetical protein